MIYNTPEQRIRNDTFLAFTLGGVIYLRENLRRA